MTLPEKKRTGGRYAVFILSSVSCSGSRLLSILALEILLRSCPSLKALDLEGVTGLSHEDLEKLRRENPGVSVRGQPVVGRMKGIPTFRVLATGKPNGKRR